MGRSIEDIVVADKALVTKDRDKYIGGSDIPAILGISPYKSYWQVLQEKAGLWKNDFTGNDYTEYGDAMEPKIRAYINDTSDFKFEPKVTFRKCSDLDVRANTDGYDEEHNAILEVKTTSNTSDKTKRRMYIAQTVFYMMAYEAEIGYIAIYQRPENFDEEFDDSRLEILPISADEFEKTEGLIIEVLDTFKTDLEYLRENPFAIEEELPSRNSIIGISREVVKLENKVKALKQVEEDLKKAKEELVKAMETYHVKTFDTGGAKITYVAPTEAKTVKKLDEEALKKEQPEIAALYMVDKAVKGRSAYVRVTID